MNGVAITNVKRFEEYNFEEFTHRVGPASSIPGTPPWRAAVRVSGRPRPRTGYDQGYDPRPRLANPPQPTPSIGAHSGERKGEGGTKAAQPDRETAPAEAAETSAGSRYNKPFRLAGKPFVSTTS